MLSSRGRTEQLSAKACPTPSPGRVHARVTVSNTADRLNTIVREAQSSHRTTELEPRSYAARKS